MLHRVQRRLTAWHNLPIAVAGSALATFFTTSRSSLLFIALSAAVILVLSVTVTTLLGYTLEPVPPADAESVKAAKAPSS
jgi:hypothetical protein